MARVGSRLPLALVSAAGHTACEDLLASARRAGPLVGCLERADDRANDEAERRPSANDNQDALRVLVDGRAGTGSMIWSWLVKREQAMRFEAVVAPENENEAISG